MTVSKSLVERETEVPEIERVPPRATEFVRDERNPNRFLVHRTAFTDWEVLNRERKAIFNRCWLYVGHASEVSEPSDFVTRSVGGRSLLMTRDKEGQVRVWLNTCRHRGAEVCRERSGNSKTFRCFYHSWVFGGDGRLISLPDQDSYPEGFDKADYPLLAPARVDEYRGFVFVSFNPDAPDLEDYLAEAAYFLDLTADQSAQGMQVTPGSHEYSVQANWKLLAENSSDGYHAVPVHRTYLDVQRERGDEIAGNVQKDWQASRAIDLGNGHTVTVKEAPWGRPVARWKKSMGEESRPIVEAAAERLKEQHGAERGHEIANLDFNLLIFPNLVLNNIMAIVIRTFDPVAPDLMNVNAWSLAPSEEDDAALAVRNESFLSFLGPGGLATPDDNEALESCQRGYAESSDGIWNDVSRGMDKPVPAMYDELQMRTFWRRWDSLISLT